MLTDGYTGGGQPLPVQPLKGRAAANCSAFPVGAHTPQVVGDVTRERYVYRG